MEENNSYAKLEKLTTVMWQIRVFLSTAKVQEWLENCIQCQLEKFTQEILTALLNELLQKCAYKQQEIKSLKLRACTIQSIELHEGLSFCCTAILIPSTTTATENTN